MLKDIIFTALIITFMVVVVCALAMAITEYTIRSARKEDRHNYIKFRSVKYYKKKAS